MKNSRKANYLIEIRYFGKAKEQIKFLIREVDKKFRLKKGHKIPHITLIQPFYTKNHKKLVSDFNRLCSKEKLMKFTVDGFGVFPFFVVFAKVKPSHELLKFKKKLLNEIRSYCFIQSIDRSYKPHTTIALNMGLLKFFRIWFYLLMKKRIAFTNNTVRITLLKDRKILYEYDFTSKKLLNRTQAKSRKELSKTFKRLKSQKRGR